MTRGTRLDTKGKGLTAELLEAECFRPEVRADPLTTLSKTRIACGPAHCYRSIRRVRWHNGWSREEFRKWADGIRDRL